MSCRKSRLPERGSTLRIETYFSGVNPLTLQTHPAEFNTMKPNIFMSYSRREVGFVDDLTYRLEKEGFKVWLDYRSLIPGEGQVAIITV